MKKRSEAASNLMSSMTDVELLPKHYQFFAKKIYDFAGVHLPESDKNQALMKNRLSRLLRKYALADYDQLVEKLKIADVKFVNEFVSCLTTNKTEFFREIAHFDFLRKELKTYFNPLLSGSERSVKS